VNRRRKKREYDRAIVKDVFTDLLVNSVDGQFGEYSVRQMIAKVARAEAKDAVDELMEQIGAANPHLEIRRPDRSRPFPPPEGDKCSHGDHSQCNDECHKDGM
jgi:hypothetical protein